MKKLTFSQSVAIALAFTSTAGFARTVTGLNTFSSATVISSSQVNANFNILKTELETIPLEVNYLSGVTSAIQAQLNSKLGTTVSNPTNSTDAVNKQYADDLLKDIVMTSSFTGMGNLGGGNYTANPTGSTFIGSNSGKYATTSNSTFVGFNAGQASTGSSNTGLGSMTLQTLSTGSGNVAVGKASGGSITVGSYNTLIGYNAGGALTTGSGNVIIGPLTMASDVAINDSIVFGAGVSPVEKMRITDVGNVGIGTTSPAYKLEVNGSVAGTSPFMNLSDARFKKDIELIPNALEKIISLEGVSYNFRTDEYSKINFSKKRELGLIAQNVETVFPEAVSVDGKGFRSVAYSMLISPIVEAIKEMNDKNTKLAEENKMLKDYLCHKDPEAPFCE